MRYFIWMWHLQRSLKGHSLSPWVIQSFTNKGHQWHHGSHHFFATHLSRLPNKKEGFLPKFQSSLDFTTWATKYPLYWYNWVAFHPQQIPKNNLPGPFLMAHMTKAIETGRQSYSITCPRKIQYICFQKCFLYIFRKKILYTTRYCISIKYVHRKTYLYIPNLKSKNILCTSRCKWTAITKRIWKRKHRSPRISMAASSPSNKPRLVLFPSGPMIGNGNCISTWMLKMVLHWTAWGYLKVSIYDKLPAGGYRV